MPEHLLGLLSQRKLNPDNVLPLLNVINTLLSLTLSLPESTLESINLSIIFSVFAGSKLFVNIPGIQADPF